jgi:MFS family permease
MSFAIAGLVLSVFLVRDTHDYAKHESTIHDSAAPDPARTTLEIFRVTSWKDRTLFSASQAGFVNNLNDGMAWGLLPLYFASHNLTLQKVAFLSALYPAVWSIAQLGTGSLSDVIGRKKLITGGMIVQGLAIFIFAITTKFSVWATAASFLGLGTAMVYPTLLAVVSDVAHPSWRASAVGVYRLWRDAGYAAGALLAGFTADLFGVSWAIVSIAVLTVLSGVLVSLAMSETVHERAHRTPSNPAS